MDSTQLLTMMIGACFFILLVIIFAAPLKFLFKIALQTFLGAVGLTILNFLGLSIGANILTSLFVGFLGLPGFLGLLALNFII